MIVIADFGLGNISALCNVYRTLNIPVHVASERKDLDKASRIILPGVGSFDRALSLLSQSGMRERIQELVVVQRMPLLGICVGMQILANGSDEGESRGLGWIAGQVKALTAVPGSRQLPIPHMGWNTVKADSNQAIFRNIDDHAEFYFLHSFHFVCDDEAAVYATSSYGIEISCAIGCGNIYGVQFHPEKSHRAGVSLLKNFSEI